MIGTPHFKYLDITLDGDTHEAYVEYETWEDSTLPYMTRPVSISIIQIICDVDVPESAIIERIGQLIKEPQFDEQGYLF